MAQHRILVPMDFTPVSDIALEHAIVVGKAFESEIMLLHIIGSKKEMTDARLRMEAWNEKAAAVPAHGTHSVRIGSIFEDIDDVAVEQDANLVIMGTHGLKGMQFLTGGRALRIVTNCSTPFIITQERGIKASGYDDIVVPLDLHQDTKQKLSTVAEMAKYFNGRVHIISPAEPTSCKTSSSATSNLPRYFAGRGINTPSKSPSTAQDLLSGRGALRCLYQADLISIMNLHEKSLMGILGQTYEQQIITDETTPCSSSIRLKPA